MGSLWVRVRGGEILRMTPYHLTSLSIYHLQVRVRVRVTIGPGSGARVKARVRVTVGPGSGARVKARVRVTRPGEYFHKPIHNALDTQRMHTCGVISGFD